MSAEQLAAVAAAEAVDRALVRLDLPTVKPATVAGWSFDGESVDVIIDGDEFLTTATNASPVALRPDSRVLVLMYPPAGVTVFGVISGNRAARVRSTGAGATVSAGSGVNVNLPMPGLTGDTDIISASGDALSVAVAGEYEVSVTVNFGDGDAGARLVRYQVNSATPPILDIRSFASNGPTYTTATFKVDLVPGDLLRIQARQTGGAGTPTPSMNRISVTRIGPGPVDV